jgi:hypothetical protein
MPAHLFFEGNSHETEAHFNRAARRPPRKANNPAGRSPASVAPVVAMVYFCRWWAREDGNLRPKNVKEVPISWGFTLSPITVAF